MNWYILYGTFATLPKETICMKNWIAPVDAALVH